MLINGEWVASRSAKTFPVYDPSPDANADDVNRAVAAAKAAFEEGPWASTTAQERGRVLFRLAEKVRQNLTMLAELECRNSGKPIVVAEFDINDVATCFEYYGGLATKVVGYVNPVPDNAMSLSLKEPMGVAGQIIPWNYPLMMAAWKLAPALAAGCTCVLKPAEQTPLTALELAKWFDEVGLPKGVVNVITGFGESCGSPLVRHPDVNKIAFTGSATVGKIIVKEAADTVKRVTLELGGKNANIVFADADLEKAAATAPYGVFDNAGQDCCARSRILVQRSVYDRFMELLEPAVRGVAVGDPGDEKTEMGPLISAAHLASVSSYVDADTPVAFRGSAPEGPGFWFPPTVVVPRDGGDRVVTDEVFGPVVTVQTFADEADAIKLANDTEYGLSGSIWTENVGRAMRVSRGVEAGNLSVNSHSSVRYWTPFGGVKQSGLGRELGPDALAAFTETKNVFISTEGA
jgi:acyl-CoA reductase-like NAD-dependent aldehyde dehydrogenase